MVWHRQSTVSEVKKLIPENIHASYNIKYKYLFTYLFSTYLESKLLFSGQEIKRFKLTLKQYLLSLTIYIDSYLQ